MTDLADREWRLIREEARPGPECMAYDAVAAETAADGGPRTVRVYRWEPSTLSLGYRFDEADIDWEGCAERGVDIVRRPTGGGAIYHDSFGDISYSITAPADELPGDLMDTYELLCEPLLAACRAMGVPADFAADEQDAIYHPACYLRAIHPAHDVLANGRKLSGNAQYRRRDSVIQHGSLTYRACPAETLACFVDPPVTPETFSERVTSVEEEGAVSRADAVALLEDHLTDWCDAVEGEWTDAEHDRARELVDEQFGSDEWTRAR